MRQVAPSTKDRIARSARDLIRCPEDRMREVTAGLTAADWQDLLSALSPALHPYLEYRLRRGDALPLLPAPVQGVLARAHRASSVMDLQRRSVLRTVVAHANEAGIESVLLKGAALAHIVYPEPRLRPMSDIDFWVADDRLTELVGRLVANGFELPPGALPDGRLTPRLSQRRLLAGSTGVIVELHGSVHSLEGLPRERVERCWTAAVAMSVHGIDARMLSFEDALLHTCLHLSKTNRFANSQVSLLDVALMVDAWRDRVDWASIARDAREHGVAVYVTLALSVAGEVWDCRMSDTYRAAVGDVPDLAQMKALAIEQVWAPHPQLPSALERAFREPGARARLTALAGRALAPQPPPAGTRGAWSIARLAAERLARDIRIKFPAYLRAWARGDLAIREFRRRANLAARRGRIGMLAGEAEARLRDQ